MLDKEMIMRTGETDLTADDLTPTANDFYGGDLVPLTYVAVVEKAAANTSLALTIEVSDDNSTFVPYLKFPSITAAGVYRVTGKCNHRYRRCAADVTGTSPDFGAVVVAPELGGEYEDW